ncbi:efflux RND transporter periplasmic adaptor subunit [Mariprofundus ferrooxydans]|nr:efflux RND transporter periplasmic adaptor subunit [Mariprofundus ferrooxydans]
MNFILTLALLLCPATATTAEQGDQGEAQTQTSSVTLSPQQMRQIGLKVEIAALKPLPKTIQAPGTVRFNGYHLADVTSLVDAVVSQRHVRLGDQVSKGKKLVTLTSSALAQAEAVFLQAQAEHRKSRQEWIRIKALAKQKIVSQSRLQQVETTFQSAQVSLAASRASLASYGLRQQDIAALQKQTDYGALTLHAPIAGTVIQDDFRIGQQVAAGTLLMTVVDETTVWVEAKVPESQLFDIRAGQAAIIRSKTHADIFYGKVANIHHQLDPITRTGGVRLEVKNPDDSLQPGMFVQVEINAGSGKKMLLLPVEAVQRLGGKLVVFIEKGSGRFERREVRVGKANMGLMPVIEGVKTGESVVVKGAFVLASELAKSSFEAD